MFVTQVSLLSVIRSEQCPLRCGYCGMSSRTAWPRTRRFWWPWLLFKARIKGLHESRFQSCHHQTSSTLPDSSKIYYIKILTPLAQVRYCYILSIIYKRWLIRDGRQYFESFRRWGLAFWTKLRDVRPLNFKKVKRWEHTILLLSDKSCTNNALLSKKLSIKDVSLVLLENHLILSRFTAWIRDGLSNCPQNFRAI